MQNSYYPNNYDPTYIPPQNNKNDENFNLELSEGILKSNIGRKASIYMSFPDSIEWRDKIFTGIIMDAGRDFILMKTDNNLVNLLWSIYINYIEFEETINF